jgi:hypothetical protein
MGTRGTWGFVADGDEKLTYNHFDSYPDGLGVDVLDALREKIADAGIGGVREAASALVVVKEDTPPTPEQQEALRRFADQGVSTGSLDEWYVLLRNTQGDFKLTLESGVILDGNDFASDSLFCEWGYVVDLDNNVFEVYQGFNHGPDVIGRFASRDGGRGDYLPITLVASFPLDDLPNSSDFTKVVHDATRDDDEEDE